MKVLFTFAPPNAKVAELVDALDSKSSDSNIVRVRFPPLVLRLKVIDFQPFLFESISEMVICAVCKTALHTSYLLILISFFYHFKCFCNTY